MKALAVVNFGGPRSEKEVSAFLTALLTDQEVIRSRLPSFLHRCFFSWVAKKRSLKIIPDYRLIGGRSPIFEDTEAVASFLKQRLSCEVFTFHRYLTETHGQFLKEIEACAENEIFVFPLFPQFSYATTGSIARFFAEKMCEKTVKKLNWVKSYAGHPGFIQPFRDLVAHFLEERGIDEEKAILFFTPHGLPQEFICQGDIYQRECEWSFELIARSFPRAKAILAYQSQFGRGEWIRPYTKERCETIHSWGNGYEHVVFIPLSFTSDHIETLFEVEHQYLPLVKERGFKAHRCPALNRKKEWLEGIVEILKKTQICSNSMLLRP